ncbi:NEDD8 ligase DCN1 Ecym_4253 [Eremothecium cymbalariae DBVPG|uniref:Defective in cullin neddylation protein n=1 Tax=Eremothecium cymbalariae (strain CBS 270.75 / DBVPG 7215 / KCTC 17166 / NRRL Y-17582) TaxID=931890 RepID=G8JTG5_ERECY|nr:hypothetical protein Ecym_4253 [Eremothecium cymbalariae DBVPG\
MQSNARQRKQIKQFMSITSMNRATAEKFLNDNRWSLDYALDDLYTRGTSYLNTERTYDAELYSTFQNYASENGRMDTDTLIKYVTDLGYQLEDPVTICLAQLLKVENLTADIEEEQFLSTWADLGCSNLNDMSEYMNTLDTKLHEDPVYFKTIYSYTFSIAVDGKRRQLSIDTAISYWTLLFLDHSFATKIPRTRLESWFRFLREQNDANFVTRDTWDMLFKFALKFPDDKTLLSEYSEMGAWPLIMDEYYGWIKERY